MTYLHLFGVLWIITHVPRLPLLSLMEMSPLASRQRVTRHTKEYARLLGGIFREYLSPFRYI